MLFDQFGNYVIQRLLNIAIQMRHNERPGEATWFQALSDKIIKISSIPLKSGATGPKALPDSSNRSTRTIAALRRLFMALWPPTLTSVSIFKARLKKQNDSSKSSKTVLTRSDDKENAAPKAKKRKVNDPHEECREEERRLRRRYEAELHREKQRSQATALRVEETQRKMNLRIEEYFKDTSACSYRELVNTATSMVSLPRWKRDSRANRLRVVYNNIWRDIPGMDQQAFVDTVMDTIEVCNKQVHERPANEGFCLSTKVVNQPQEVVALALAKFAGKQIVKPSD
uniref:PUB domain-containing protein n=1 Tax=Panagrellus redivivus TaxID=6233 RepID=A0A7E4VQ75_PANRE